MVSLTTTSIKHFTSINCAPGPTWTETSKRKMSSESTVGMPPEGLMQNSDGKVGNDINIQDVFCVAY
jgi:hypothetical protein